MKHGGYDPQSLALQPPALWFQTQHRKHCRYFDLKQAPAPAWLLADAPQAFHIVMLSANWEPSLLTYGTHHGTIGPYLILLFRLPNVL
jgi:hypothetical protein